MVRHLFDFGCEALLVLRFFNSVLPESCTASCTPHGAIAQITASRAAERFASANWGSALALEFICAIGASDSDSQPREE